MQESVQPQRDGNYSPEAPLNIINIIHEESELSMPFIHALSLVYASKGEIEVVDVRRGRKGKVSISIRKVLERWGLLPAGSGREEVVKLGIKVKKIVKEGNAKKEIEKRLAKGYHDICVIGIKRLKGIERFFGQDLSDFLARHFRQTTLYIPSGAKSFVDENTGAIRLKKILVPVAEDPSPAPSFQILQKIIRLVPEQPPEVYGLHVGEFFPFIPAASLEGLRWKEILIQEGISQSIVSTANKEDADLIIMSTNGRSTFSQKIVGSITEQVLGDTPCPVLAVAVV